MKIYEKNWKNKNLDELQTILAGYRKLHNKTDSDTKKRAIRAIEIEKYQHDKQVCYKQIQTMNCLLIGIKFDREFNVGEYLNVY